MNPYNAENHSPPNQKIKLLYRKSIVMNIKLMNHLMQDKTACFQPIIFYIQLNHIPPNKIYSTNLVMLILKKLHIFQMSVP